MGSKFETFDRSKLHLLPLAARTHELDTAVIKPLESVAVANGDLRTVASRIIAGKTRRAAVVLMMGAHVLRSGVQRYLIDLMDKGYITCISTNGAGAIHDFEFALIGQTTESVARYVENGQFGLWKDTGRINDIVSDAARKGLGLGEAIGKAIIESGFPYANISILGAAYSLGIPVTIHVGIGYDITHEHPNCDGAAYGIASYRDFLIFARVLEALEGGVIMNFGSAVMAPEVFLKALAMVRNVAHQDGRRINKFTSLVCDLRELPAEFHREPPRDSSSYYFRPWKTMLVRTIADGGESFYVRASHAQTVSQLWTAITTQAGDSPL